MTFRFCSKCGGIASPGVFSSMKQHLHACVNLFVFGVKNFCENIFSLEVFNKEIPDNDNRLSD
jgi:hypothetical protein